MTAAAPWLSLMLELTRKTRTWAVWKSPDSALRGEGDVDSVAAATEWPIVVGVFGEWARVHGFDPVVRCTHFAGLQILVACAGESPLRLLQLDVYSRFLFRGAPVVTAEELAPLAEVDPRGFRRLRPGAEALLLLLRGLPRAGRPPTARTRAAFIQLAERDPAGVAQLAEVMRFPRAALAALESADWDRAAALAYEARTASRLLVHPGELLSCLALDYRRLRGCSLVDALERGRRVEGDRALWLAEVARTHPVKPATP